MLIPDRFSTKRLTLRPPDPGDVEAAFRYASDPAVTRFMDWPTHRSIEDTRAFFEAVETDADPDSEISWAITLTGNSELIGMVSCHPEGHKVSFGYVLAKDHWGKGYASEIATQIVAYFSSVDSIARIWATCDVDNLASARVLEKAGLIREGVLRNWTRRPNLPGAPIRDVFVFAKATRVRE